ncbi:MAG: sulfatase-like hydrolase/transferase [Planctomycetes bacterium]|nr:sulfatase-like hydrolase/transferase [Planctomycetota bacterium]
MKSVEQTRRSFLKMLGIGAAALTTPGCLDAAKRKNNTKRPNIVLILVDDLGWADVGCFGSKYYETPNIDRLAKEGMKFTDGYAACAVCSPTRAAVMTGRYPARLGVTDWIRSRFQGGKIPDDKKNPTEYVGGRNRKLLCPPNALWMELDEMTIAEALKPAGYTSCHIGKWHLGADDWYPDRQGFDYNIGGCDFGQPPSYFDPYYKKSQGDIPTLKSRKEGEYLTDREADEAVRFITDHAGKPFFLYMAHYAVHTPIQAKQDLAAKYKAKTATHQKNAKYAAMVESVDHAVGKILNAVEQAKVADNTMIIFTSDNGGLVPVTSNLPLRSGKGYPYEGGIREPLIVRWPGVVKPGAECSVPVTSVDYFPTIRQAAGVRTPARRSIDGESIMPLLTQSDRLDRDAIFWHFPHYRGRVVPYSIIRAGDWKLIKRYEGREFELFNLKHDLSEKNDLADSMPDKVEELDAKLKAWLKRTGARMPRANPDYTPKA